MELHERLAEARKAAGFETATDAARSMGVNYPTYAGHENGTCGFRPKTAELYARKFGVSFEWLLTGRGTMTIESEDAELIQLLREAHPDVKTAVKLLLTQRKLAVVPEPGPASPGRRLTNRK